jgi:hypothetical protein
MPISAESAVEWERAPTAMASPRASYNNFIFHNVFNIHKQSRNDLSFSGKWNVRKKHRIIFFSGNQPASIIYLFQRVTYDEESASGVVLVPAELKTI